MTTGSARGHVFYKSEMIQTKWQNDAHFTFSPKKYIKIRQSVN